MNTFVYRDIRLERLTRALAALTEDTTDLREPLEKELAILQIGDWRVTDRTYLAAAEDFLWTTTLTLKLSVDEDPVLAALQESANLTAAQAAAVETLPRTPGGPPSDFFDRARAAVDNDEAVFTELVHTGHRFWLRRAEEEQQYLYNDIGVILPLRLETLFDPPANGEPHWKLSLRVVPDEVSIRRDNTNVSEEEVACLREFWQWQYTDAAGTTRRADVNGSPVDWLDDEGGKVAWSQFCSRLSPRRAAWLIAEFPPFPQGEVFDIDVPPERIGDTQPNRVGGMPPQLDVFFLAGLQQHRLGTIEVKPDELILPLPDTTENWLTSWEKAKQVGMGGEWHLPEGVTPENIESLYVIGIGDESPDELFRAHAASGEMGIVLLGSPTNTIHGAGAANLAKDAESWRVAAKERLKRKLNLIVALPRATQRIGTAIMSSASALPFIPGAAAHDDTDDSVYMTRALWPALWGHWMYRLWGLGDDTYRVMRWAMEYLYPEGPLMPLRIADQPYGLLPATSLLQWQSEPAANPSEIRQREVEQGMARALAVLRSEWATAARKGGPVVGQPTERFIQLLSRNALTGSYITRLFLSDAVYASIYQLSGQARDRFTERALESYKPAMDYMRRRPEIPYLAGGYYDYIRLPLVKPSRMPEGRFQSEVIKFKLDDVITALFQGRNLESIFNRESQKYVLPDSLLIRLMIYATQLSMPWRHQVLGQNIDLTPFDYQEKFVRELARELDDNVKPEATGRGGKPIMTLKMSPQRIAQLERALRATLDAASHRIDPWIIGLAWQRLNRHSHSARKNHRLGVYGWVDGPFIGQPGPTEAGRIHAPSNAQALAGLILRDKYLSTRNEPVAENNRQPWEMNLDSRKVRLAEEIAEEARMGFHIDDILGRRVETVVGDREAVRKLRVAPRYALRTERKDPNEVCNGREALSGLLDPGQGLIPLTTQQIAALKLLSDALDTYADLLMADAALQLVNRQVDRAAELMDAASGFSRPPTFEFTRTPPSGYQLETRALTTLPYIAIAALDDEASPCAIADPSVAAFIEDRLGLNWLWTAKDETGQALGTASLADLGLKPMDAVALSEGLLSDAVRAKLSLPDARIAGPEEHRLARQFAAQLGTQPLTSRDLAELQKSPIDQAIDQAIYTELVKRYQRLSAACQETIDALDQAADAHSRLDALRRALAWGVTPVADPKDQAIYLNALFGSIPTSDEDLDRLAKSAKEALEKRLNVAPDAAKLLADITTPPEPGAAAGVPDGIPRMARAIAELASPDGKLSVLASWPKTALLDRSKLKVGQPDASLDEDWLSVIAPVRPPMARFEALQLEARELNHFRQFERWSSSPGDPWQREVVEANLALKQSQLRLEMPRFIAAYGDGGAWTNETVAVGLLDAFSESIPLPQRRTTVAFGFNAPASRAQQAILLAVPPKTRQRLDNQSLFDIVRETRELAHARAARLDDLGKLSSLTPSMWLQAGQDPRVRLEPWPLFQP